jgi:hypothetical protein
VSVLHRVDLVEVTAMLPLSSTRMAKPVSLEL